MKVVIHLEKSIPTIIPLFISPCSPILAECNDVINFEKDSFCSVYWPSFLRSTEPFRSTNHLRIPKSNRPDQQEKVIHEIQDRACLFPTVPWALPNRNPAYSSNNSLTTDFYRDVNRHLVNSTAHRDNFYFK